MNCADIRDRLEEYALDQLDAAERATVERHLAGCPDCSRELAGLESALSHLPGAIALAAGDEQPPAEIRQRLHRRIAERALKPASASSAASAGRPRVRAWLTPVRVAAAAIALVLVVSVGWGLRLNQALSEERQLREQIGQLVDQQEIVLEVVDGHDTVRRVLLPPSDTDSRSYGKVFTRPEFSEVVIMGGRLPEAPEDEAYHVWLTADGETRLAGTLDVNDEGFGLLVIEAGEPGPEYERALVTLQPTGAPAPGGVAVLSWSF